MKKLFSKIESMLDKKQVQIVRLRHRRKNVTFQREVTPLEASEKALRTLFYKESSLFLSGKQIQTLKEYLEIHPVTDTTVYQTANRIYNDGNLYAYELEKRNRQVYCDDRNGNLYWKDFACVLQAFFRL